MLASSKCFSCRFEFFSLLDCPVGISQCLVYPASQPSAKLCLQNYLCGWYCSCYHEEASLLYRGNHWLLRRKKAWNLGNLHGPKYNFGLYIYLSFLSDRSRDSFHYSLLATWPPSILQFRICCTRQPSAVVSPQFCSQNCSLEHPWDLCTNQRQTKKCPCRLQNTRSGVVYTVWVSASLKNFVHHLTDYHRYSCFHFRSKHGQRFRGWGHSCWRLSPRKTYWSHHTSLFSP